MKYKKHIVPVLWFLVIAFVTQYLFTAFLPNIVFAIAKHRSGKPLNTWIHNGNTNANARRVVLPNPDFIYSACFYDVSDKNMIISGDFLDSSTYCSLAFYGSDVQPYLVINNQHAPIRHYSFILSASEIKKAPLQTVTAKSKQGCIIMRVLATDSAKVQEAKILQGKLRIEASPF